MGHHAMARIAVAVMAKAPIPGEAKTRLGAEIGHAPAAAIYQAFLLDTLDVLDAVPPSPDLMAKLLVCPDRHHADRLRPIVSHDWPVVTQTRPGLMGGIADAFEGAFARGADLALVTDADSPLALLESWVSCVEVAARHDVALGPTADGGYYLIAARAGARPRLADLLLGTTYDGATIGAATGQRAGALGLSVGLGPAGFDVDTGEDLLELAARLVGLPDGILARTRQAIARAVRRGAPGHAREAVNRGSLSFDRSTAQFPVPMGDL